MFYLDEKRLRETILVTAVVHTKSFKDEYGRNNAQDFWLNEYVFNGDPALNVDKKEPTTINRSDDHTASPSYIDNGSSNSSGSFSALLLNSFDWICLFPCCPFSLKICKPF